MQGLTRFGEGYELMRSVFPAFQDPTDVCKTRSAYERN
jgi:hypothetical protein